MPTPLIQHLSPARLRKRLTRKRMKGPVAPTQPADSPGESHLPPLKEIPFSRIGDGPAWNLAVQGWAELDFEEDSPGHVDDDLLDALQQLVCAGRQFFDRPQEQKKAFHLTQGEGEEGGWTRVEGEKEMFTIRQDTPTALPEELRQATHEAWKALSSYMNSLLGTVAQTLDLPPEALTQYSDPGLQLTDQRQATMLRLFRYECQGDKIVSEQHSDLGLLSLVYGEQPGLEVWDRYAQDFFPIELSFQNKPKATVMGGEQLAKLTNGRYVPGGHRVRCYPWMESRYRYSLVFIQRAHWPVPVDTDKLTTSITGEFGEPLRNMSARQLFESIYHGKYSVNSSIERRTKQKAALEARQVQQGERLSSDAEVKRVTTAAVGAL